MPIAPQEPKIKLPFLYRADLCRDAIYFYRESAKSAEKI
jgi:hypothetical protein